MKWTILTYLILCPLFFLPGVENRDAQQIFYQLSSVAVFAIGMFFPQREIKVNKIHICLGIMLLAFIGAWLRSMNGWDYAMNYIMGLLVYLTIIRTLKTDDLKFIIKGITWMLILATVWIALQKAGFDIRGTIIRNTQRVGRNSLFFHASSMGMYFAESVPLVLSFSWLGLLFLPMVKFSECSAAYLGIVVAVLFYYWFRKRILFWLLIIPMILGGVYLTYNREAFTGVKMRLPLFKILVQRIAQCPIGHGLKSFSDPRLPGQSKFYWLASTNETIEMIRQPNGSFISRTKIAHKPQAGETHWYDHPHNEYLWLGYDVGLHGLIILGFLFYFIWQRFRRCRKGSLEVAFMASLIAVGLCGIGQFPLFLSRVGHMLPFILSGFMISTEEGI